MLLDIAVCDDEEKMLTLMEDLLNSYIFKRDGVHLTFHTFNNADTLLNSIRNGTEYNVFFLDIEMPGMNGIDLARKISSFVHKDIYTCFISNFPEYMQESFSVHPFFFLQKPVTEAKFFSLLDEIASKIAEKHRSFILIDDEENEYPVDIDDILYIETQGRDLSFHLFDKSIGSKGNISDWLHKLEGFPFLECHRGMIVNVAHIHYIHDGAIILDNGGKLPLSRRNEKRIKDEMLNQVKTYLQ